MQAEARAVIRSLGIALLPLAAGVAAPAWAQAQGGQGSSSSANSALGSGPQGGTDGPGAMGGMADPVGNWPRISFETIADLEASGMYSGTGPDRPIQPYLRFDSTLLVDVNDTLQLDGLFQMKARQPRPDSDPNRDLYTNQGAGRQLGGKVLELYARKGDWRFGKFVQDFGRAYLLLPGPFAADFVEESDDGYEPTEMVGVERLHVFDGEKYGWQQLSVSAFMVDRTPLHHSFPYDEGQIHYRDGGLGNTRFPTNVMVTYDMLNAPVGHAMQLSAQVSAIRWGKSVDAERGEFWASAGADLAIPLAGSVADTLGGHYSQLTFYVEASQRNGFLGVKHSDRSYLSGSAQLLTGRWEFDATTTQRWTTDPVLPLRKDALYTATLGYNFPSETLLLLSIADERVGDEHGIYSGIRLQQTFTTCSRCLTRSRAY